MSLPWSFPLIRCPLRHCSPSHLYHLETARLSTSAHLHPAFSFKPKYLHFALHIKYSSSRPPVCGIKSVQHQNHHTHHSLRTSKVPQRAYQPTIQLIRQRTSNIIRHTNKPSIPLLHLKNIPSKLAISTSQHFQPQSQSQSQNPPAQPRRTQSPKPTKLQPPRKGNEANHPRPQPRRASTICTEPQPIPPYTTSLSCLSERRHGSRQPAVVRDFTTPRQGVITTEFNEPQPIPLHTTSLSSCLIKKHQSSQQQASVQGFTTPRQEQQPQMPMSL